MSKTIVDKIQDFICYHQGKIIEFEFEIARLHKQLKEFKNGSSTERFKKLITLYEEPYEELEKILDASYAMIKEIFNSDIRFTIKIINEENGNTYIEDLYRDKDDYFFSQARRANEHTPFDDILFNNKSFFISNDLEEDFKQHKYRNPRLIGSKIEELIEGTSVKWEDCWQKHDNLNELKLYNSLMVIPMTLKNNPELKSSFKKEFFNGCKKCEGMIWGFFCLDSIEKNAFASKDLQSIGKIIADILSLYFIFYYEHTDGSETFNNILSSIIEEIEK